MKRICFNLSDLPVRLAKLSVGAIALTLLSVVTLHAQNFEKGNSSDLKGLTRLYINAGKDIDKRDLIAGEIKGAGIPGLVIVDSREEAEIVMRFGGSENEVLSDLGTNPVAGTDWTMTTLDHRIIRSGRGLIFVAGKEQKRPRIVMSFASVQDSAFEKRPSVSFAEKFVKAYKEANGLK